MQFAFGAWLQAEFTAYGKKTARGGRNKLHLGKQGNAVQHNVQKYYCRLCWQLTGYDGTTAVQNNTYHSVHEGVGVKNEIRY